MGRPKDCRFFGVEGLPFLRRAVSCVVIDYYSPFAAGMESSVATYLSKWKESLSTRPKLAGCLTTADGT